MSVVSVSVAVCMQSYMHTRQRLRYLTGGLSPCEHGVRKIRMAIGSKGKGKSGGARVLTLTVLVSEDADVTLLTI